MQRSSELTLEEQSSIKRMSPVYLHRSEMFYHYTEVTDMESRVAECGFRQSTRVSCCDTWRAGLYGASAAVCFICL